MKQETRCEDVAHKLVRVFGWRQTYPVHKLHRSVLASQPRPLRPPGEETWLGVRALRGSSGGILDPDDRVCDVADDRETLMAELEGNEPGPARTHGGDGASGSSVGTASPDLFRVGVAGSSEQCVEVGAAELEVGGGLQVRRGSEPTLHQDTMPARPQMSEQSKRWSAAVVCREESRLTQKVQPEQRRPPETPRPAHPASHFTRHSNRLSMQFSGSGSGAWLEAAERVSHAQPHISSKSLPRDTRKEPLGQDNRHTYSREESVRWERGLAGGSGGEGEARVPPLNDADPAGVQQPDTLAVSLVKGERGLGFTITTRDNPTGGHCPIYIKNILLKGAAVLDGRLRAGDRLLSVNGVSVAGLAQAQVVTLLRNTPTHSTVRLQVHRTQQQRGIEVTQQSPSKFAEKAVGSPLTLAHLHHPTAPPQQEQQLFNNSNTCGGGSGGGRHKQIVRLEVPVHDSEKAGLGISVKGKVTVGPDPHDLGIFIRSVLNGGAASRDGRLHMNDQLLCVNGVSLEGQSNVEAMETLRRALLHTRPSAHRAETISLEVARRAESMESLSRWKDDTPPGHDSTHSLQHDNVTVIYNTNNNNINHSQNSTADSIHSLHSKAESDAEDSRKRDSFEWSRLDGWNPVIDRLTGLRNESYYMATQHPPSRSPSHQHHAIIEEDYGTPPQHNNNNRCGTVYESGGETDGGTDAAFSRDAVGRRSMSEKRHAAVDANTTTTYNKIKLQKAVNAVVRGSELGPALGMRKSSSLESLQTAVQASSASHQHHHYSHRRHPPLKHWLTDEGEMGAYGGVGVGGARPVRGAPQQSSLSHKKPSVLRSLASMLGLGGKSSRRGEEEAEGPHRGQPHRASEKSIPTGARGAGAGADPGPARPDHQQQHYGALRSSSGSGAGERRRGSEKEATYGTMYHRAHPARTPPPPVIPASDNMQHYVNYELIQQNLNARREKLSEVQIGQMRRLVAEQRARAAHDRTRAGVGGGYHSQRSSSRAPPAPPPVPSPPAQRPPPQQARPYSNYYEYESLQPHTHTRTRHH